MNWYIIQYFRDYTCHKGPPVDTRYARGATPEEAIASIDGYGTGLTYEIHDVRPELVPVVLRGLTEATTEQLKQQLQRRGWKVRLT
jgi:hypothetical protein